MSVVIGVVAGGASALAVVAWIPNLYPAALPYTATVRQYTAATGNAAADALSQETWRTVRSATVSFYTIRQPRVLVSKTEDPLKGFSAQQLAGTGVFVTSDGWIAAPASVAPLLGQLTIVGNGTVLERQQTVNDPVSGLVFIKVNGDGYPILPLENAHDWLHGYWWSGTVAPRALAGVVWDEQKTPQNGQPRRTLALYRWPVVPTHPHDLTGQPVVNAEGKLIGLLDHAQNATRRVLPISLALPVLGEVFIGEEPVRTQAELAYHDVSQWQLVDTHPSLRLTPFGALITDAGEQTGLQPGDIITHVESIELSQGRDIGLLLHTFAANERIELTVVRDGREQKTTINL